MAVEAVTYSGIMFAFLKVAYKTGAFSYCNVFSLNNLRVTARTAKALTSF